MTVHLWELTARCPQCGAPPRIRAADLALHRLGHGDPDDVVLTYQCHRSRKEKGGRPCDCIYEIRVRDFRSAA